MAFHTENTVQSVETLWQEGKSYHQIARTLKLRPNAVMGVVRRLKEKGRVQPRQIPNREVEVEEQYDRMAHGRYTPKHTLPPLPSEDPYVLSKLGLDDC